MTIQNQGFDWQRGAPPGATYDRCSPALISLKHWAAERWSTTDLGCFGIRPIRLGEVPSTHSYGAAVDLGYAHIGRARALDGLLLELIGWSQEWGITAVHDYVGSRIWHAARTAAIGDSCTRWWRAQKPDSAGMGKSWATWFHVEVAPWRWGDARSAAERGIG